MPLKIILTILIIFTISILYIEIDNSRKNIKIEKIAYEEVNVSKETLLKSVEPLTKMGSDYWEAQESIDTLFKDMVNNEK